MPRKMTNELMTGLVIVAAIGLLTVVGYTTGNLSFGKRGYTIKSYFTFTSGLRRFAPIRLSGVEVGEVKDFRLQYDPHNTQIEVILWIDEGVKIREDSLATVSSLGMMGEKYVEVRSGSSEKFLSAGGELAARDPLRFEDILDDLKKLGGDAHEALVDFRRLVNHADEILVENKPKISGLFSNLEETSEYFRDFALDVKHHPWKVLMKGQEKSPEELAKYRAQRLADKQKAAAASTAESVTVAADAEQTQAAVAPKKSTPLKTSSSRNRKR